MHYRISIGLEHNYTLRKFFWLVICNIIIQFFSWEKNYTLRKFLGLLRTYLTNSVPQTKLKWLVRIPNWFSIRTFTVYGLGLENNGIEKYGFRGNGIEVRVKSSNTSKTVLFQTIFVLNQSQKKQTYNYVEKKCNTYLKIYA